MTKNHFPLKYFKNSIVMQHLVIILCLFVHNTFYSLSIFSTYMSMSISLFHQDFPQVCLDLNPFTFILLFHKPFQFANHNLFFSFRPTDLSSAVLLSFIASLQFLLLSSFISPVIVGFKFHGLSCMPTLLSQQFHFFFL